MTVISISSARTGSARVSPGSATGVSRTRLRLTRRGRAVVAALVSFPLVVALMMLALNGGGATATSGPQSTATVTVEAGQSLWSVAAVVAPDASPADVVLDILAVNQLDSASVQAGQVLVIPARYVD